MSLDVSIIYVNYKTSDLILQSIKSVVEKVTDISYEFIVVDNNTENNLEKKLSEVIPSFINLKCLYLPENIGFGAANNEGMKHAKGKTIFLLNPDTVLINNAIKILFDFLQKNPDAGACGGNLYNIQNQPSYSFSKIMPGINWEFQELTHFFFHFYKDSRTRFHNFSEIPIKVAYISGADLMLRTELFKKTGGFPNDIFMYWDDVDICRKISELGYNIYCVPQAKIFHLESQSFDEESINKSLKIKFQEKYRHIYLNKNLPKYKVVISNLLYYLFLQSRILILKKGIKSDYYKKRMEYYKKYKP